MPATPASPSREHSFTVANYDLAATLGSGQAFRWQPVAGCWEGVIHGRWVRLVKHEGKIHATVARPEADWSWLADYLQVAVSLDEVVATFPPDEPLREAVRTCQGLRLLRQEVWECLASFILSSTKQIVQIQQIVGRLCERFGEPVPVLAGRQTAHAFPTAVRLAGLEEVELRQCGMGFRAPYLLKSARMVASGEIDLARHGGLPLEAARAELIKLPGVGRKVADCVLLFGVGHARAFPVDVWILKALRRLNFSNRKVPLKRLLWFSETHFGPQGGYAQQYLFHFMRQQAGRVASSRAGVERSRKRGRIG